MANGIAPRPTPPPARRDPTPVQEVNEEAEVDARIQDLEVSFFFPSVSAVHNVE